MTKIEMIKTTIEVLTGWADMMLPYILVAMLLVCLSYEIYLIQACKKVGIPTKYRHTKKALRKIRGV